MGKMNQNLEQKRKTTHKPVGTGVLDGPRANDVCLVMVRKTTLLYAIDFLSVTDRRGRRSLQFVRGNGNVCAPIQSKCYFVERMDRRHELAGVSFRLCTN